MNAILTLHRSPQAGFDEPFEMLAACHERVARMLALLERLQTHLTGLPQADEPARQAACDVMRYFDLAAPKHHEDEEIHVFPALRASPRGGDAELADRLRAEHQLMVAAWTALRPDLAALSQGHWPVARAAEIFARWQAFCALYRRHAKAEDDIAYPAAEGLIGAPARQAMGQEMATRRGVPPPAAQATQRASN